MILYFFSVRDMKAGAFLPPFCAPNRGVGIRMFEDAVFKDEMFQRHGSDFALYIMGEFHPESGKIVGYDPDPLVLASDFLQKENGVA